MLIKAVYERSQIELAEATAHHHEYAGLVERFNDTLCGLKKPPLGMSCCPSAYSLTDQHPTA
jgi:hypothetical protein